ncbi:prion-inhibition and propagation-domain-containing protein [Fusarium flagelliforme]|uniref:prion-inhibition and propagation-domain-containing protein n=1 Tax=Fusarium flagelliforme TaxID=2675880 RepID=UPI001E8CEFB8|nr:prion-inhibition and propagation-domain-containing protein [Fusarium flagelliforme]KAH7173922.1 prion-inhibition and propagation-domain-containing protein [Fusarium flagelliforme]
MSGLEATAFIIGVAGLFSSCVDAFSYFKLAQHANREVEIVLLKLDIEKARLLIWGDYIGIFSASHHDPRLLDGHVGELIKQILFKIESLLTDSEQLRTSYGTQTLETPPKKAVDYVSSKSLAAFRTSASRFWTRNAQKLVAGAQGGKHRSKWAVYERQKFQALINDLSQFVDSLFELTKLSREVQDRVITEDIESILDVSQLRIIEEATEDSYRVYSQVAASVRASTEAGTVDRRTVEEHLRDVAGNVEPNLDTNLHTVHTTGIDLFWSEVNQSINYAALTSSCRKLQSQHPCDIQLLGSQAGDISNYADPSWNISSKNEQGGNTLWQLINRMIDIKSQIMLEEDGVLGELLKERNLSTEQDAFMQNRLPLIMLIIYCSPCVCLIHTALAICRKISSPFVKVYLRPDDRLVSSCCVNADRTLGLKSALEWVREWVAKADSYTSNYLASFLDAVWVDRRLDHLYYERQYKYEEKRNSSTRVLIVGEADYLAPIVQKAPGRIPNASDIWCFENRMPPTRKLFGRFVESRPIHSQPFLHPQVPVVPPHVQSEALSVEGLPSPVSSSSKRRRSEIESVTESPGGGYNDEMMENQDNTSKGHV